MNIKELKAKLQKRKAKESQEDGLYLSTGSTLLNLAISGDPFGGWRVGSYNHIVGDSASGKTALSLSLMAEACLREEFDEYRLVHDDIEHRSFNLRKLFGSKLAERLETRHSISTEEMYYNIDDDLKKGVPFITVVDSESSLDSEADEEKFQEQKKANRKGKDTTGSFALSKPKLNSSNLRRLMTPLQKNRSILILISQTRDNVGVFGYGDKKTHAGGKALRFYSTIQMWSSIVKKHKKKVRGKDRTIGIQARIDIKKNSVTGREGRMEVPIYYSLGFDDTGSCVSYLVEEGHWKKNAGGIIGKEFDVAMKEEKLIEFIEEKEKRKRKLQKIVGKVWKEIELASRVNRKQRYE